MSVAGLVRCSAWLLVVFPLSATAGASEPLAPQVQALLKTHCHRCHGQDGSLEGGFNYVLNRDQLVARRKLVPGSAEASPLYKRVAASKMPPPGEEPRPSPADIALLKRWIDAGAPGIASTAGRPVLTEAELFARILADLETVEKRSRRFVRYFSLAPLANAGLSDDELQTYRHAVAKLLNSLSWHPRITRPVAIDPTGTLLRIDLRDFQWDANLWNRVLAEYPYGVFHDTAAARACSVATGTRLPCVRADWFVATASRPPLYQDLLQLPASLAELERLLRVDAAADIQQERVARAGFNGSGVSKNNRLLERHVAIHGAYWRTYDFDAVPQNLVERDNLLPDRRNLFAHPLGPGFTESSFQHAGGEAIFNLPNGLHAYMLVNAVGNRVDKAPTAIVSDPKRPDRAVETGVSCMSCHVTGILPKSDQIRDHVHKSPRAFSRTEREIIDALYVPEAKMRRFMDEDAERYRQALEQTGARVSRSEPVMALTLRYEADVDLPVAAAEAGLKPDEFLARLGRSSLLAPSLGALKTVGGTVPRQVLVQAFADLVRELRLGSPFQPTAVGQLLPDNTGEIDPLEGPSSLANSMVFSPDRRRALFASADRSVRLWDVERGRELRRFVGHTASVWCVAFSADGRRALSGGMDETVRLWDVETGQELRRLDGHADLVTAVAFTPDGRRGLSAGYDQAVIVWDLEAGREVRAFANRVKYPNAVAFLPDGRRVLIADDKALHLWDVVTGEELRRLEGHRGAVVSLALSADGERAVSGSDDGTLRLWDLAAGRELGVFTGHVLAVKSVALAPDGRHLVSGGADGTVRLWDAETARELRRFGPHADSVVSVAFSPDGRDILAGGRDSAVLSWAVAKVSAAALPAPSAPPGAPAKGELRPLAVVPVGGNLGPIWLAPDRPALYYLNLSEVKAGRLDTLALKRGLEVALAEGTETLVLSRDGKALYAAAPGKTAAAVLQVIDTESMKLGRPLPCGIDAYDLAAGERGLVFVSGGAGREWTDVTVVDSRRGAVVGRLGGVWQRSLFRLSTDGRRLFVSTQGVQPGALDVLQVPEKLDDKPAVTHSPAQGRYPLGGEFVVAPDGKFLLCKTGTVLRLAAGQPDDLQHAATVAPFLAAVVAPESGAALLLTADGSLKHYSYPDFKLRGSYALAAVGYQAALDGKTGRLYVAAFDPRVLTERPRARGCGDLHIYDVKALLEGAPKQAARGAN